MWILCTLVGLVQLITLLMLSGVLFAIAAVSRLMEILIILIHPTAIFLLRQFVKLIILLTILITRRTSSVFHNLCELVKCNQQETIPSREPLQEEQTVVPTQSDVQTPLVNYLQNVTDEEISERPPVEDESHSDTSADKGIIEPLEERPIICNDITDC